MNRGSACERRTVGKLTRNLSADILDGSEQLAISQRILVGGMQTENKNHDENRLSKGISARPLCRRLQYGLFGLKSSRTNERIRRRVKNAMEILSTLDACGNAG